MVGVRPEASRMLGAALWALQCCFEHADQIRIPPAAPAGSPVEVARWGGRVLEETRDHEQIVQRVAALDIGKAELVCCVRVPGPGGRRRVQEVMTYPTMTRALLGMVDRLTEL